ncbi:DoxX family membrane protein [Natrononativus amylolyticus]|uniref:DoxX family membrane protein n=1 Tax=Natrononativus amylolyticus TaxID=2963434 RepID=UPI0020CE0AA4|nr:DoxX family membrane protein [Natrononativus amylolyticus]
MVASGIEAVLLLSARLLFGGVIAFMGLNHFLQLEGMAGYAEFKGLPAPKLSVVASGVVLVLGGLGIVVGAFPLVSALAVAAFLVASALLMHDFWAVNEDQQQDELTAFLKNVVMAGGALAIAVLTAQSWAFSLGIGL